MKHPDNALYIALNKPFVMCIMSGSMSQTMSNMLNIRRRQKPSMPVDVCARAFSGPSSISSISRDLASTSSVVLRGCGVRVSGGPQRASVR